jgi:hypothetical protein
MFPTITRGDGGQRGDGLPAASGKAVGVSPSGWVWGVVGGMTKRRLGGRRSVGVLLCWGLVGAAWHYENAGV